MQPNWFYPLAIALAVSGGLRAELSAQAPNREVRRVGVSALRSPDSLSRQAASALDRRLSRSRRSLPRLPWSTTYQFLLDFAYTGPSQPYGLADIRELARVLHVHTLLDVAARLDSSGVRVAVLAVPARGGVDSVLVAEAVGPTLARSVARLAARVEFFADSIARTRPRPSG